MMKIRIENKSLAGKVQAISSKSYAQRAIFAALLAKGESKIQMNTTSADIDVALCLVEELGGKVKKNNDIYTITSPKEYAKNQILHVGESGTSLRFLIPVVAALGINAKICREGSLIGRTNDVYKELLPKHGAFIKEDGAYIIVEGKLSSGKYSLPGNISSQFISGLMLALGYLDGKSEIEITTELGSKKYVDMTISVLKEFGLKIDEKKSKYIISGEYKSCKYIVEGDWSNALFFLVAGVEVLGLNLKSLQADRLAVNVIKELGFRNNSKDGIRYVKCVKANEYRTIDAEQMPDAMPILALLTALIPGKTAIINIKRLRLKESDRVVSIEKVLKALGVDVKVENETILINSVDNFNGCESESFNDHRIVMMLAIASKFSSGDIIIDGVEAVNKSYPGFFEDLKKVGAKWQIL